MFDVCFRNGAPPTSSPYTSFPFGVQGSKFEVQGSRFPFFRNGAPPASLPPPPVTKLTTLTPFFHSALFTLHSSFPGGGEACRAGQTRTARSWPHFRSGRSSVALPAAGNSPLPHALRKRPNSISSRAGEGGAACG